MSVPREELIEAAAFGAAWAFMQIPRLPRAEAKARWDAWTPPLRAHWILTAESVMESVSGLVAIVPREATDEQISFALGGATLGTYITAHRYAKMIEAGDLSKPPEKTS